MHGALLVDKPEGITSFDVIRKMKRCFPGVKLGHSGTLDPFATGLLVVLLGKATRLQDLFLTSTKGYEGTFLLGKETTTDDITGEIVSESSNIPELSDAPALVASLQNEFVGRLEQTPPQFSAIKIKGKKSYELARKGLTVEHKPRWVEIQKIELRYEQLGELGYQLRCSKGTYVRSLGRDIGAHLGCGACVKTLRRTFSAPFRIEQAQALDVLLDLEPSELESLVLPIEKLIEGMPSFSLERDECQRLRNGDQQPLKRFSLEFENTDLFQGLIALRDPSGEVCAFAEQKAEKSADSQQLALRFVL